MEIDNVVDIGNDYGLVSPVGDDDLETYSNPDFASGPTSLQKFHNFWNEKIVVIEKGNI